ncbi:cbb3-type cytochrome oxidase assembly protein CcoS [Thiomicrorhabdus lithotrophica]|uniref:Cbb3-type cytochrome oxidase assembly protein CcoS n=1 Tax=Thiomicrorhabdus lithotrophica TaxID=2949997 RepID=A0ABY8CA68_9GAMM|nr:cbb3-type cytochrome oxidase assembly protein CcoS [Thiomicrorhabdus lithotrophica]WEJ62873.1 cbb3-type cytochrome oxidase assembly protein CcoS [Thiomicrorhabdus lithotrophica]
MDVIYGLIPMMLIFGFLVVVVFIWMAKTGHFDDMDGQANRIFMDDEYPEEVDVSNQDKKSDVDSQESVKEEEKEIVK